MPTSALTGEELLAWLQAMVARHPGAAVWLEYPEVPGTAAFMLAHLQDGRLLPPSDGHPPVLVLSVRRLPQPVPRPSA